MNRLALIVLTVLAAGVARAEDNPPKKRVSVVFFIGDGMGSSQITLGKVGAVALKRPYHFDRFKIIGLANTRSADLVVTDSAASGTALSTGVKTNNKMIGQDPSGKALTTILESAHAAGYATGLVSTARITHATPACFAAHVKHRSMERKIAAQYLEKIELGYPQVLIGGGARSFKPADLAKMTEQGYQVVTDAKALAGATGERVVGLLAKSHVPYAVDGGSILPQMAKAALAALGRQKKPFFLMVEGGRVDHGCHQHDAVAALHDQLDLDATIGATLDWAKGRDDVLIVVTADHATGNLGISERTNIQGLLTAKASATTIVRGLAKTDTADTLQAKVKAAFGVELTAAEAAKVLKNPRDRYWGPTALGHMVSHKLGVQFYDLDHQQKYLTKTYGHDGAMVPVFAWGASAGRFAGLYENVEIPRRMAAIMGLPPLNGNSATGQATPPRKGKKFFHAGR